MNAPATEVRAAPATDPGPEASENNPVHAAVARLESEFSSSSEDAPEFDDEALSVLEALIKPVTAAERCLAPALACLGWAGDLRRVREALPHFDRVNDVESLRAVLARLGYRTARSHRPLSRLDESEFPFLLADDSDQLSLAVERDGERLLVYHGETGRWFWRRADLMAATVYSIAAIPPEEYGPDPNRSWLWSLLARFKALILSTVLISLAINVAALTVPLFVMHVYDLGIGTRSADVVKFLAAGACIVIATDLAFRSIRSRLIAYFGARLDALIGMGAFQQLLQMPISMVETAPVATQVTRLRQFESVRDVFTGTLFTAIIDIPFIFIFLIAIAYWGGHLVWIPLALVLVYVALAVVMLPIVRQRVAAAGQAKQRLQLLLLEIFGKRRAIRNLNGEDVWISRHRDCVIDLGAKNQRAQLVNYLVQNIAQSLVNVAGIVTLGMGALMVVNETMTPGALIGTMALVWRVLSPLQTTFLSVTRLEQSLQTCKQINRLMSIKSEVDLTKSHAFNRRFLGQMTINRLVFRYPRRAEPAVRGVSLQIATGEFLAITGPSGSGKSTLLKMIVGLYQPLGGAVLADGLDLRQINQAEWRGNISYLPETATFFYGTLAQNFRLVRSDATDQEIVRALVEMDVKLESGIFPDGLETRVTAAFLERLSDGFKQRLALARCFVKSAPLYLIDNPSANLDSAAEARLVAKLKALKGRSTVILTTFRPSHMLIADRLAVMRDGLVTADGKPEAILQQLTASV